LDLKEGYHHVLMDQKAQKLLGFRIGTKWYHYRVLPFGLSLAVWTFSKIMRPLIGHWRSLGIFCGNHLDDMWIAHPCKETLIHIRDSVIFQDIKNCGFVLAEKGHPEPTQEPKFYGLIVNTKTGQVVAPETKIETTLKNLQGLLSTNPLTARRLSSVVGQIMSLSQAFAYAKTRCLEFYTIINAENRRKWKWDNPVHLTQQAILDVKWMQENLRKNNGCPAWRPSQIIHFMSMHQLQVGQQLWEK